MATLIKKVREQAPDLAPTYEAATRMLIKKGARPNIDKAAVLAFFDHSSSTETLGNRLYSGHEMPGGLSQMRYVSDLTFCGGLFFDDDGSVPTYLFDTEVQELGDTTLKNYKHVLDRHSQWDFGGTSYLCVLRKIIELAGFDESVLYGGDPAGTDRRHGIGRLLGHGSGLGAPRLSVKGTAAYPTYAAVVTDGEPQADNKDEIIRLLTLMSQLPIFVQFIGVGAHRFEFLKLLDTLGGRYIDNCGFFDAKGVNGQEDFLERMLGEFASKYYPGAREIGLLTA